MALSPGIPTSFVPKQPTGPIGRRPMNSGRNVFLIAALGFAAFIVLIAAGVFAYNKLLQHTLASKQAKLAEAQASVNEDTIEEFVRLRDRLSSGNELLDSHVALSQFFTALEALTLQNVRFTTMKLSVAGDHSAQIQMNGTAKNFNALAVESNTFAAEKRIKRAIFSNITISDDKLVKFTLTADVDPNLITEGKDALAPSTAASESNTAGAVPTSNTLFSSGDTVSSTSTKTGTNP